MFTRRNCAHIQFASDVLNLKERHAVVTMWTIRGSICRPWLEGAAQISGIALGLSSAVTPPITLHLFNHEQRHC